MIPRNNCHPTGPCALLIKPFKKSDQRLCSLPTRAGTIAFSLTRSSRRRTMEISVAESTQVRVLAPRYAPEKEIHRFIHDKADWIIKKIKETHRAQKFLLSREYANGNQFLFLGTKYELEIVEADIKQGRISFDGLKWTVRIPVMDCAEDQQPVVRQKLIQWYRAQAKEIFGGRVFHYARMMGMEPQKVTVKTQKRIWGSCDHRKGTINLNWYLVLSPLDVIDYVVVHELCHLKVPHHSKRFWGSVEKVLPDYKKRQRWLKVNAHDMALP